MILLIEIGEPSNLVNGGGQELWKAARHEPGRTHSPPPSLLASITADQYSGGNRGPDRPSADKTVF